MILPSYDMRDSHLNVVDYNRQVIKRMSIRTEQHEVFNLFVVAFLQPINDIVKSCLARDAHFQSHGERFTASGTTCRFLLREITKRIAALIDAFSCLHAGPISNPLFYIGIIALLARREVTIGFALLDQTVGGCSMLGCVVGLKNNLFVIVESEPFQAFND